MALVAKTSWRWGRSRSCADNDTDSINGFLASEAADVAEAEAATIDFFLASARLLECEGPTRGRDWDEQDVVVVMPVDMGAGVFRQPSKLQMVAPMLVEKRQ